MEVLNSLHNVVRLVFLATLCSCPNSGQEVFSIVRNPGVGVQFWNDKDEFKVPESKCSPLSCTNWKASPVSVKCQCKCSDHKKATFGFYFGSWTCTANTKVRTQAGCNYTFENEYNRYPLKILEKGTSHNVILPSTGCSVNQKTSRYFTCDGNWTGIDSQSFSINKHNPPNAPAYTYKVNIGSGVRDDLLGRIISLNITCPGQEHSCLLFKLKGTFQCNEDLTPIITTARPTTPSQGPTQITTTSASDNVTTKPTDNGKEREVVESGGLSSSVVVGIVVTMVIIVAIVIVIIGYIYWKRKRGESVWIIDEISSRVRKLRSSPQAKNKTEEKTPHEEEPVYAEIPEELRRNGPTNQSGIYSYAFQDPDIAFIAPQESPYNKLVHNQRGPEQAGVEYSTAVDDTGYNVLKSPSTENQVMAVNKAASESTMNEGHPSQELEPEYHVLEDPSEANDTSF